MTTSLPELLERIDAAPDGPDVHACFDLDGTLITGFSARAFYDHRLRRGQLGPLELGKTVAAALRGVGDADAFAALLDLSLGAWRGRTVEELDQLGERIWRSATSSTVHSETLRLVDAHQRKGHTLAIATSATRFQAAPVARELGFDDVLCTEVEVDADGRLTGRAARPLWGRDKAAAFTARADGATETFAYANGDEDVPLLAAVGRPAAISPEPVLREIAEAYDWPVLDCVPRGGRPGAVEVARTAAFYGGMAGALATGVGLGLLNRSRRTAVDVATTVGADVSLAAVGVELDVTGTEHLWAHRPCVFVFNHQSKIDPPIVMKLLRTGFTGVAKKEAANVPVWGVLFRMADVAFLDRGNTAQARAALAPAVRKVCEEGFSLAISPEGTRSSTARLGPFKKGAFHIAMQAEVPMVPIVIHNAHEVMWRGAQTIKPGRVAVEVLPAVDTARWTVETIDEHVAEVHGQFVAALSGGVPA